MMHKRLMRFKSFLNWTMTLKKIITLSLLTLFLLIPLQSKAEGGEKKYVEVSSLFKRVIELNQESMTVHDDIKIQYLIEEKNTQFKNILLLIRGSFVDYDVQTMDQAEITKLQSKIGINRSRGHAVAVQRDQFAIDYYFVRREIGGFIVYLVEASRNYQSKKAIVKETKKRLTSVQKKRVKLLEPLSGQGDIYEDRVKNHAKLLQLYNVYSDFLDYVLSHPEDIVTTNVLQKISLLSSISYFNNINSLRRLNYTLAPLRIDAGGIIVSCLIFLLTMIAFPFISKYSHRLFLLR